MASKIGRPTDNPKTYRVGIRIDEKSKRILDNYCNQENVNQTEAVRRGIEKLDADIKK